MLTIWGRMDSSNVQAVMWAIGELGLPFERHDAGHRFGKTGTAEFRSMNPNGLVPVLIDGDEPIFETGAILRYLGSRYGTDPFWPKELSARARVNKWAEWAKLNVATGFSGPVFWRVVRTAPGVRNWAAIGGAIDQLAKMLDIAEARLSANPYLAGETFTLADIQFGHVLYRYFDIPIARPSHPAMRRYYEAMTDRPAFREHVMVSYEALRVV